MSFSDSRPTGWLLLLLLLCVCTNWVVVVVAVCVVGGGGLPNFNIWFRSGTAHQLRSIKHRKQSTSGLEFRTPLDIPTSIRHIL